MGENLYMSGGFNKPDKIDGIKNILNYFYFIFNHTWTFSGSEATNAWYDEIKDYNWSNPGFNFETGHFTQVVWKGSTEFGIGAAVSADKSIYICANYFPPGNWGNEFEENVPKKDERRAYKKSNGNTSSNNDGKMWEKKRKRNKRTNNNTMDKSCSIF